MPKVGRITKPAPRNYHFKASKGYVPKPRKPTTTFDALARAALPGPQFTERLANLLGEGIAAPGAWGLGAGR